MRYRHVSFTSTMLGLLLAFICDSSAMENEKKSLPRRKKTIAARVQSRMQSALFKPQFQQDIFVKERLKDSQQHEDEFFKAQQLIAHGSYVSPYVWASTLYNVLPNVSGWFSQKYSGKAINHWKNPIIRKGSSLLVVNNKYYYVERAKKEHSFKLFDEQENEVYSFEAEQGWMFNPSRQFVKSRDQKYFCFFVHKMEGKEQHLYLVDGVTMKTISSFVYRGGSGEPSGASIKRFVYPDGITPHFMLEKEDGIVVYDIARNKKEEFLIDGTTGKGLCSEDLIVIESTDKKVMMYDLKNNYAAYEIACQKTIQCLAVRDDYCLVHVDGVVKVYDKKGAVIIESTYRSNEKIQGGHFGLRKDVVVITTNKGLYIHTGKEEPLFVKTVDNDAYSSVKFNDSGDYACIEEGSPFAERTVYFYDVVKKKELKKIEHVQESVRWRSGTSYAILSDKYTLYIFDAKKGDFAPIMPVHSGYLTHPAEGSAVVVRDTSNLQKAIIYQFFNNAILKTDIEANEPFDAWSELDMQWSWCGKLFGCLTEKMIHVYDSLSGKCLFSCERDRGVDRPFFDFYFCCKDRYFVVLSRFVRFEDRRVRVFDVQDGFKLILDLNPKDETVDYIRLYDKDLPRDIACTVHSYDRQGSISRFYFFK